MTRAYDPDTDWNNVDQWESERLERIAEGRAKRPANGHGPLDAYEVSFDEKGKLKLPESPSAADVAGCCAWLTAVFHLDRTHPITGGAHEGLRGPDGHVVLHRLDASALRFEPASRLNRAASLSEQLTWRLLPTDGASYAYTNEHARRISDVVRYLCGRSNANEDAQETAAIVGAFLLDAECVDGHTTYGHGRQHYEAATALQREPGMRPRYLVDVNTGEVALRVIDLTDTARKHHGGSLARGWLDARLEGMGWQRVRLDGHSLPGRTGRQQGAHARCDVYRGHLPTDGDGEAVTT